MSKADVRPRLRGSMASYALYALMWESVAVLAIAVLAWLRTVASGLVTVMDVLWGLGFVVIATARIVALGGTDTVGWIVYGAVTVWALRLAIHLHLRTRHRGEDPRYVRMREGWGDRWWWGSFVQVFLLQGIIMLAVAAPLRPLLDASARAAPDQAVPMMVVAGLLFAVGLLIEAVSDEQLRRFRAKAGPGQLLTTGLFAMVRHPNHLGEAMVWWGLGLAAIATSGWGVWPVLFGPLLLNLLLRWVSGVRMSEVDLEERPGFAEWVATTPALLPWPRPKA